MQSFMVRLFRKKKGRILAIVRRVLSQHVVATWKLQVKNRVSATRYSHIHTFRVSLNCSLEWANVGECFSTGYEWRDKTRRLTRDTTN